MRESQSNQGVLWACYGLVVEDCGHSALFRVSLSRYSGPLGGYGHAGGACKDSHIARVFLSSHGAPGIYFGPSGVGSGPSHLVSVFLSCRVGLGSATCFPAVYRTTPLSQGVPTLPEWAGGLLQNLWCVCGHSFLARASV